MSIATLLKYLVGERTAILRIASTRSAIWLGALFVLAAGFAREYDAKDLSSEPWFLVVPLAASLTTSLLLFSLVFAVGERKRVDRRPFWSAYRPFLALYWMTAPLALLYALPVERFLSDPGATATNLALLGIVSVWRVSLMVRVVNVYFGAPVLAAFVLVMLFADTVALGVLYFTPVPIFNIMGGIPLSASDRLIQGAALWVGCLGVPTWLVWFVGAFFVSSTAKAWDPARPEAAPNGRVQASLWCLAGIMILGFGPAMPFTQPEQQLRHTVETAFFEGRIDEAIATMSRHRLPDFPPHWDPPPWHAYRNSSPPLLDVLEEVIERPDCAEWVRAVYLQRLRSQLDRGFFAIALWPDIDPSEKDRYVRIFERMPLEESDAVRFDWLLMREEDTARKDRLRALVKSAGGETVAPPGSSLEAAEP